MLLPHQVTEDKNGRTQSRASLQTSFSSAHLVGICGAGMKALAEMLEGLGCKVSGTDQQPGGRWFHKLKSRGLSVHRGHDHRHLPQNVDVLVYSPAIGPANPERRMASRLNIPQMSYSQMLGHLMQSRIGVSIAGTHGKSTTTAMAASILGAGETAASAIIGAELCGSRQSGWKGNGDLFVVESCEYRRSFLDLAPRYAAILGIEADHFDYFRDFDDTKAAFSEFARLVDESGVLLVPGNCRASIDAARSASAEVLTFSREPSSDWWAADERRKSWGTRFRTFFRGEFFTEICLRSPGRHNVINALAAVALSHHAGATAEEIREGLYEFPGLCRRFEQVGSWRGVTLIDDYAHHPTEIQATLSTARKEFGSRKIWCVFQPHQVSRTRALMDDFASSFSLADEVLIAPVFAAREDLDDEPMTVSDQLAARIVKQGDSARFCVSLDRIIATLEDGASSGDVLITMGAGDIDRVHHEFTRRLQRNHPA